jgi:hypothetical protein
MLLIIAVCVTVGIILGICVIIISPSPTPATPATKTIHYPVTPVASTQEQEITEEVTSKDD